MLLTLPDSAIWNHANDSMARSGTQFGFLDTRPEHSAQFHASDSNGATVLPATIEELPTATGTMRAKHYIALAGIIGVALLLWGLLREKPRHMEESAGATEEVASTPSAMRPNPEPAPAPSAPRPAQEHRGMPSQPAVRLAPTNAMNAYEQAVLAEWQGAIEFYGEVVDENTNAVAGATVRFSWTDMTAEDGASTSATESDAAGLFSLQGARGRSLTVWVSKDGYLASGGGQQTFLYGNFDAKFNPDPQNPVVFTLRKKGQAKPLVKMKRNYGIPRDGTAFAIDLVSGQAAKGENGNLVVQCWTEDQGKARGEKYDWHCRLTIPGGGVVPTDEEFAFLAPESGYKSTTEITMPADRPDWKSDVNLKFFYRLADGRYGRMTFSMIAGGQHFCMIDSVLNPSGSRNLESDPQQGGR